MGGLVKIAVHEGIGAPMELMAHRGARGSAEMVAHRGYRRWRGRLLIVRFAISFVVIFDLDAMGWGEHGLGADSTTIG
jgi:hypothetical protein